MAVDEGRIQPKPAHRALSPEDARRVRFSLHRVEPAATLEAWAAALTDLKRTNGLVGTCGEFLDRVRIQVFTEPRVAELHGVAVQGILAQAELGIQRSEGRLAFGRWPSQAARRLEACRVAEPVQPLERFAQASVCRPAAHHPDARAASAPLGATRKGSSQTKEEVRLCGIATHPSLTADRVRRSAPPAFPPHGRSRGIQARIW